jgi:hypothetical protein
MANWQRVKGWRVFAVRGFGFSPYIERGAQQLQSTSCRLCWNLILPVKYSLYLLRGWADSWELTISAPHPVLAAGDSYVHQGIIPNTGCSPEIQRESTHFHDGPEFFGPRTLAHEDDSTRGHGSKSKVQWVRDVGQLVKFLGILGTQFWPIRTSFLTAHPWLMAGGSPKPFGFTSPLAAPTPGERESGLGVHHSGSSDFKSFPRTNGEVCWFWAPD